MKESDPKLKKSVLEPVRQAGITRITRTTLDGRELEFSSLTGEWHPTVEQIRRDRQDAGVPEDPRSWPDFD